MTVGQFKKRAKKIPDAPGVYFFLAKNKKVLYIGKATSLRDRVRSYFAGDLMETRGPLLVGMLKQAHSIDWRQTDSVLEALLLEANLIKTYKPKANTDSKDDKSWNFVAITKEEYPAVVLVRGKGLQPKGYKYVFGPFPHGMQLQQALKLIRKIFPYRDHKCKPLSGKPCFNRQLRLCPGTCTGEVSRAEYAKTLRYIALLFKGKKKELIKALEREMKAAAKAEEFERAGQIRKQVFALQHIQDISLIKDEYRVPGREGRSVRIEAYDVAHLRGSAAVGVMVVVEDGQAAKSEYRKFRLRASKPGDDTGALREVLSRRLGHDEWPMPRLIVVDGARAQVNAAEEILKHYGVGIPVVGVTKDEKHRPRAIAGERALVAGREHEVLLANAEAHRFAITYHRKRSRTNLRYN